MKLKLLGTPVVASALLLGASVAVAEPNDFYVLLGGQQYLPDEDREFNNSELDDTSMASFGAGIEWTPNWATELVFSSGDGDIDDTREEADVEQWRLDALYMFQPERKWVPYVVAGLGELKVDPDDFADDTVDTQFNLGVGIKRVLTDRLALRADARAFYSFDESLVDYGVNLALTWGLGPKAAPKAKPAPAPAPAPAPVKDVDTDGDGVVDRLDKCPNTVKGAKVDADGCQEVLKETISVNLQINFDNDHAKYFRAVFKPSGIDKAVSAGFLGNNGKDRRI